MKLLITGATGYLGARLCRRAVDRRTRFGHPAYQRIFACYRRRLSNMTYGCRPQRLDLARPDHVRRMLLRMAPNAIIHAGAVNPGQDVERMMPVNVDGSRAVAEAAAELGARLVHLSSDVVHDGTAAPYADDAEPTPLDQIYPRSKAAGEIAVAETLPEAAIARTSLIYSTDLIDHGTRSFMERYDRGEKVRLFTDVWRQPIWIDSLAEALLRLAEGGYSGRLNVAGVEPLTRAEFGLRMLKLWGNPTDGPLIETVAAADLGLEVAHDLRLDVSRARRVLRMELPGVSTVLEHCNLRKGRTPPQLRNIRL